MKWFSELPQTHTFFVMGSGNTKHNFANALLSLKVHLTYSKVLLIRGQIYVLVDET